jgi:hypothetical protein
LYRQRHGGPSGCRDRRIKDVEHGGSEQGEGAKDEAEEGADEDEVETCVTLEDG